MSKLRVFLAFVVCFLPFIIAVNLLGANTFALIISLIIGPVLVIPIARIKTHEQKLEERANLILGSLYDPEEILEQTEKSEVKEWISVFDKLGWKDVAKEYTNYISNRKFNFDNLPYPDEIRNNFIEKYKKLIEKIKD